MFEALTSLRHYIFGPSAENEASLQTQRGLNPSPRGWFSGWNISFLFGTPANKPSFLQRIFPWFFSAAATPHDSNEIGKEIRASMSHYSKEPPMAPPETISLYLDASDQGKKVDIKKQGQKKIDSLEDLAPITEDLMLTNDASQKNPTSYLESFDKDANRGFIYTLENPFISNQEATHAEETVNATAPSQDRRSLTAHKVIDTIAETIFSDNEKAKTTLGNNLKGISQQALFASPLLVFMQHPPHDGSCLIQGNVSDADFSYSLISSREIAIKAKGIYQNGAQNTLFSTVQNDQGEREVRVIGFPKDHQNLPTGELTGSVALTITASVGDDGRITALSCTSMETSWKATER